MDKNEAQALVASVPHWHHKFEIYPGVWTTGSYDPLFLMQHIRLPQVLTGKTVLDIGTSDGFFARELHQRGAAVTCIDYRAKRAHGFYVMEQLLDFEFPYHQMNVYDIDAAKLGTFDYVLFLGVLYHLPDMMAALVKVRSVCREMMFLESHIEEFGTDKPLARYYPGKTLAGDQTNFWAPNPECVRQMLSDVGFMVGRDHQWGTRYFSACLPTANPAQLEKIALAYGLIR